MPVPKSITKIDRQGNVTFTESVDRTMYFINELSRAALRDVGKFVCNRTRKQIKRRSGNLARNTRYWVRRKYNDMRIGYMSDGFYGWFYERGSIRTPKLMWMQNAIYSNIAQIRRIEGQYLSAIEDEQRALTQINEEDMTGGDE